MYKLKLVEWGDPILRTKSKPVAVKDIKSKRLKHIIKSMFDAVMGHAVGLSANQLGAEEQILVVDVNPTHHRAEHKDRIKFAAINPKIIWRSKEFEDGWEGNLSLPGVMGIVRRAKKIKVKYLDENSHKKAELLEGFVARIFQHEYEELQGLNFISSMPDPTSLITRNEYEKRFVKKRKIKK